MKRLIALISGFIFSLGLGFSGMTQPHIVKGFLDLFGSWDWRLMGVMIGAIGVHAITYRLILKRSSPILDAKFIISSKKEIDKKLILGSIIFGLGWGWAGICPGPGFVSLASGSIEFFYFVGSMLIGMKVFQILEKKNSSKEIFFLVDEIPTVKAEEIKGKLQNFKLIDVRRPDEFVGELGHIKNSELATLGSELEQKLDGMDKNREIIFVCRSGKRSADATKLAVNKGFHKVYNLEGGMLHWNELKFPVERD